MTADAVLYPHVRGAEPRPQRRALSPRAPVPVPAAAESVLDQAEALARLHATMVSMARNWFRLRAIDAEDVVQSAFVTFLEIRARYTSADEHAAILVGILRNKCHEHIRRATSEQRKVRRYCTKADAARENPWIRPGAPAQAPSVVDELTRREQNQAIRNCIERLGPGAAKIVSLITGRGFCRGELIAHFHVNANTLDTRLRACRGELRRLLAQSGIAS